MKTKLELNKLAMMQHDDAQDSLTYMIKGVEVPLIVMMFHNSSLFQHKCFDVTSAWLEAEVKGDIHVLSLKNVIERSVNKILHAPSSTLTNLEELSFLMVLAFPYISSSGLDLMRRAFTRSTSVMLKLMLAMYCMITLEFSVLPEPLSPE